MKSKVLTNEAIAIAQEDQDIPFPLDVYSIAQRLLVQKSCLVVAWQILQLLHSADTKAASWLKIDTEAVPLSDYKNLWCTHWTSSCDE